jgi:pimeloyl-ACP methyl ester carboxylesterase
MARIEIVDRGRGPAVVLLHGQPGTAEAWTAVTELLLPDVRVIVPDRPGYGKTGGPAVGIQSNGEAVLDLLDERGIASATFVGHSWSGAIALWLAEERPDRVDGLVLAASVGPHAITVGDRLLATRVVGETLTWAGSHAVKRMLARERLRVHIADRIGESATDVLEAGLHAAAWRTILIEQRAMIKELPRIEERLGAISAPSVVIARSSDRVVPASTASALVQRIPNARLVTVDGGHALPVEAPDAVAGAILSLVGERTEDGSRSV